MPPSITCPCLTPTSRRRNATPPPRRPGDRRRPLARWSASRGTRPLPARPGSCSQSMSPWPSGTSWAARLALARRASLAWRGRSGPQGAGAAYGSKPFISRLAGSKLTPRPPVSKRSRNFASGSPTPGRSPGPASCRCGRRAGPAPGATRAAAGARVVGSSGTWPAWTTTIRGPRSKLRLITFWTCSMRGCWSSATSRPRRSGQPRAVSSRLCVRSRWRNSRRPVCDSVRGQVAGRVELHAGHAQPLGLARATPQGQPQRFQADADLELAHGPFDPHRDRASAGDRKVREQDVRLRGRQLFQPMRAGGDGGDAGADGPGTADVQRRVADDPDTVAVRRRRPGAAATSPALRGPRRRGRSGGRRSRRRAKWSNRPKWPSLICAPGADVAGQQARAPRRRRSAGVEQGRDAGQDAAAVLGQAARAGGAGSRRSSLPRFAGVSSMS